MPSARGHCSEARYAHEAGFRDMDVLPVDVFGFWRFYRLTR